MEGSKLGKYEIRGTIGRGAVGVVYEAWDPVLERTVAVKTLPLSGIDPDAVEKQARFQREAQAAGRLNHPNIVAMFDYGETLTCAYIVMEYLPGPSLKKFLEIEPRPPAVVMWRIMDGLLTGLQQSHRRGVMHRDIKPANIVFGDDDAVKITDFGVAHLENSDMTQVGSVLGTPGYMSPEQVLGNSVDARSDVYSAGVVFYEMLTGRRPFQGSTASVMHKIVHDPPPPPSEFATGLAPQFDEILAKVLAKDPADRYLSAVDFANALRDVLCPTGATAKVIDADGDADDRTILAKAATRPIEPAQPQPPPQPKPHGPVTYRTKIAVAGGAGLLLAAVIAWLLVRPAEQIPNPPTTAVTTETAPTPAPQQPAVAAVPQSSEEPPTASPPATPPSVAAVPPPAVQPPTPSPPASPPSIAAVPPPGVQPAVPSEPPPAEHAPAPSPSTASVPATDPLASARPEIKEILATIPCSVFTGDVTAENVRLTGVTALGDASTLSVRSHVQRSIAEILPGPPVELTMRHTDGPYCSVFDTLKRAAITLGPDDARVVLSLGNGSAHFTAGSPLRARIDLPDHSASVTVDYFTTDGMVEHWLPGGSIAAQGKQIVVDGTTEAGTAWKVGKRTGTNVISVIASSAALFPVKRPKQEAAAAYLADLKSAMNEAAGAGNSLTAQLMIVEISAP